mmetsp:Transcript_1390/g.3469  ORF Transcript_1390/g.3469 Transcript_1390/m.3469 type:complete len:220 (+) Transcript_1390:3-662(+)
MTQLVRPPAQAAPASDPALSARLRPLGVTLRLLLCHPLEEVRLRGRIGLSKGQARSHQLVNLVGHVQVLSHSASEIGLSGLQLGHRLNQKPNCACGQPTGLHEGLFGALQISVVTAAESDDGLLDLHLHGAEDLPVGPHDFEEVIILLLRHNGRAGREFVGQLKESGLLLREHHHVRGEARAQHDGEGHRLKGDVLEHPSAQAAIHGIFLHTGEAHLLR